VNYAARKLASHRRLGSAWAVLAIAPLLVGAAPSDVPRITMEAFLLSSETGKLSPNAINNADLLGNAVAGAATAQAALIRVKVAFGPGAPSYSDAKLRLVAKVPRGAAMVGGMKSEAGRIVIDRAIWLGPAGDDGNAYAAFLLYDVGCSPIALDATLLTAKPLHGHADLGFQCYE
jgi:hypothetical protein